MTFNTLRPRKNGRHFADGIFKCIFLNENVWISIKISLKFVPKGPINNIPALVQIMAWRRPGDKPISEPMMVNLPTHICVSRSQWVKLHHDNRATKSDRVEQYSSFRLSHLLFSKDSWWRHQMETFTTLLAFCAGDSPVAGEFPPQRPVTRSFDVFFDLRLNKRLSKQLWGWWF